MIKYIEYKKQKYPVRVGYRALKMLQKETGMSFEELQKQEKGLELENYEILLFHSLVAGSKAEETAMPFKMDDMIDLLDECFMEFVRMIPEFFPDVDEDKLGKLRRNRGGRRKQVGT